jgi:hypothetical protein
MPWRGLGPFGTGSECDKGHEGTPAPFDSDIDGSALRIRKGEKCNSIVSPTMGPVRADHQSPADGSLAPLNLAAPGDLNRGSLGSLETCYETVSAGRQSQYDIGPVTLVRRPRGNHPRDC